LSDLDLLDVARRAAQAGAELVRTHPRPDGPGGWGVKAARDYVSDVDRAAERRIADLLRREVPGSRVLGEELAPDTPLDGLVWVVDPLDGTTNFLHGVPHYAVSVAAAVDGVLEAGAVLHVPTGDCRVAARGRGAFAGDARLRVSTLTDPAHALVATGFPFSDVSRLPEYLRQLAAVAGCTSGIRRFGSAALDLADVASGRYDAFWEQRLAPWDVAAGTLLVREAGGRVTDFAGDDAALGHGPVLAGSPAMVDWMLERLADARR